MGKYTQFKLFSWLWHGIGCLTEIHANYMHTEHRGIPYMYLHIILPHKLRNNHTSPRIKMEYII